jgi:hypothetical protein
MPLLVENTSKKIEGRDCTLHALQGLSLAKLAHSTVTFFYNIYCITILAIHKLGNIMRIGITEKLKINHLNLVIIILFILNFCVGINCIGLAAAEIIKVEPQLPAAAPNDGTGNVTITWNFSYGGYSVTDYTLAITYEVSGNQILQKKYTIDDKKIGEHSPLSGVYVWDVPRGQPEGIYLAELQVRTKESGTAQSGVYWRFAIAKHQGTLTISKFEDLNKNGVQDQTEQGLSSWQFQIISPNNDSYVYITNEDGKITIPKIASGTYDVVGVILPGYKPTNPTTARVELKENTETVVSFGSYRVPSSIASKTSGGYVIGSEAERRAEQEAESERVEAERRAEQEAESERVEAERRAEQEAESERMEAERRAEQEAESERLEAKSERVEAERRAEQEAEVEYPYQVVENKRTAKGLADLISDYFNLITILVSAVAGFILMSVFEKQRQKRDFERLMQEINEQQLRQNKLRRDNKEPGRK